MATKKQKGKIFYTSFEAFPLQPIEMLKAQNEFPELSDLKDEFYSLWSTLLEKGELSGNDYNLRLILGDARRTINQFDTLVDCWFLDGFSPAKNPELWEEDLLKMFIDAQLMEVHYQLILQQVMCAET